MPKPAPHFLVRIRVRRLVSLRLLVLPHTAPRSRSFLSVPPQFYASVGKDFEPPPLEGGKRDYVLEALEAGLKEERKNTEWQEAREKRSPAARASYEGKRAPLVSQLAGEMALPPVKIVPPMGAPQNMTGECVYEYGCSRVGERWRRPCWDMRRVKPCCEWETSTLTTRLSSRR